MKAVALSAIALLVLGCTEPDEARLRPDAVLQAQLGLTASDRVHRVRLSGGEVERADPMVVTIAPGDYVEFVTMDWLIHEVIFERDSLDAAQWSFLVGTDQASSPPLIERDSRYVLLFEDAPAGRYAFTLQGNARAGRGAIVVSPAALAER